MSNTKMYTGATFNDQLNAYKLMKNIIYYCKNCDKPKLCVTCKTSIGEATLMILLTQYYDLLYHKTLYHNSHPS